MVKTLRQCREDNGLNADYVAGILEIKTETLNAKERGDRRFNNREIITLLDLYKINDPTLIKEIMRES